MHINCGRTVVVVVKTHHRATGIDRKGVRMSLPASGRWVPASDKGYAPQCHPREILLGCASWVLTISLPTHGYCYTYTYYTYINKYCIHIYCMYVYIYTLYILYIYIYYIYYILYIYIIYYIIYIYISADPGRRKGERIGAERL